MEIVDYVKREKEKIKSKVETMRVPPYFVIIQVNNDEGSNIYIAGKIKDASELGIRVRHVKLEETVSEDELLDLIEEFNQAGEVDGIIVQLPLPKHISPEHVKAAISPNKDIDGFNPFSKFNACTPRGIIDYLKEEHIEIEGKNCVVIGRSEIVGKPMSALFLKLNGNVVILHSKTKREDMELFVANADILVVATGHKWLIDHTFKFKKTCVVVDVGISRSDGKLYGDCEPGLPVRLQTPVPKGVGLLTRLALLENVLEAKEDELQD